MAIKKKQGLTFVNKASNIERLLGVSFTPPVCLDNQQFDPRTFPQSTKARFDVLICGISIGHRDVGAGTLGAFVWDTATGELLGLTCAHVAAPPGAAPGDPIYQPGPLDIRTGLGRDPNDNDIAGYLVRWVPISFTETNLVDAAVFRPVRPVWPNYTFKEGERRLATPIS
jgi:hypothetical protein